MIHMYRTTTLAHLKRAAARGDEQLFVCTSGDQLTGYCKYRVEGARVVLLDLWESDNDIVLADALVRAAANDNRTLCTQVQCGEGGMLPLYRRRSGLYIEGNIEEIENVLRGSCAL